MQSRQTTLGLWLGAVLLAAPVAAAEESLPTPYSAEQIRDGFQEGLQIVTRTWTPEGESLSRLTVEAWGEESATLADQPVDDAGKPLGPKSTGTASWAQLRDHAAFPPGTATRERHAEFTGLGRLEGWLYEVDQADGARSSFFFADDYPGPPVLYWSVKEDELVYRAEQIRRSAAAPSELDALPASALPPIPAEALRRLEHSLGRWEVRSEHFDAEGNVTQTTEWENYGEYLLPGRLVLLTHRAPKLGTISKTLVYYSLDEERWKLVDVNQKGELWILSGGLEREVITSEPRKTTDGRTLIVRFTHESVEADSFEALMEVSFDQGKSWRASSRQYLTRVP